VIYFTDVRTPISNEMNNKTNKEDRKLINNN